MSGSGVISFYIPASNQPQVVSAANPLPVVAGTGSLAQEVQGNVAAGAVDSGKPVKIGGVYNTTAPTYTNTQRGDLQIDARGNLKTLTTASLVTGSDARVNIVGLVAADSGSGSGLLASAPYLLNSSNVWDRQRGSAGEGTITKPYAFSASAWRNTQRLTAIGTTAIVAAGGAGVVNFLTSIQMTWQPGLGATVVQILDGATVIAEFDLGAGAGTESGQLLMTFPVPLAGTANTALNVAIDTVGPVKFNAQGYRATP